MREAWEGIVEVEEEGHTGRVAILSDRKAQQEKLSFQGFCAKAGSFL